MTHFSQKSNKRPLDTSQFYDYKIFIQTLDHELTITIQIACKDLLLISSALKNVHPK